jgi:hypothetical protein
MTEIEEEEDRIMIPTTDLEPIALNP